MQPPLSEIRKGAAFDVILGENFRQFVGVIPSIQLGATDQGDSESLCCWNIGIYVHLGELFVDTFIFSEV